jgi:PPOX class probable F420-dependent enzyme
VSRREQIRMDDAELGAFLQEQRVVACASIDRDGLPHVMPLWYLLRDGEVWVWTYAASQKVRNLERDPRATLMVEAGEGYEELRGAMLRVEAVIERSTDLVTALGMALYERYLGEGLTDEVEATIARQAPKRVAIRFIERSRASWDHRKLGAA